MSEKCIREIRFPLYEDADGYWFAYWTSSAKHKILDIRIDVDTQQGIMVVGDKFDDDISIRNEVLILRQTARNSTTTPLPREAGAYVGRARAPSGLAFYVFLPRAAPRERLDRQGVGNEPASPPLPQPQIEVRRLGSSREPSPPAVEQPQQVEKAAWKL